MDIYPLQDCLLLTLDENFDRILLCFYTEDPVRPPDGPLQRKIKKYYEPEEIPMYLREEIWVWEEGDYVKEDMREELIEGNEYAEGIRKHFKYAIRYKVIDKCKSVIDHHATRNYYNLGDGGRWCRGWTKSDEF